MSVFARATFTAANGTAVSSYVPELGTLTKHPAYAGTNVPVIFGGRVRAVTSLQNQAWRFTDESPNDWEPATAVIRRFSGTGILDIFVRLGATAFTGYMGRWQNGNWQMWRFNAGAATQLGGTSSDPWPSGEDRIVRVQAITKTDRVEVTLWVNGVQRLTFADTTAIRVTAKGHIGWQHYETGTVGDDAGLQLDSIVGGFEEVLSVTSPVPYQVFQRGVGDVAAITARGFWGGAPSAIEASWNNGDWQVIDPAPAHGRWSGSLPNMIGGQGALRVRYANDHGVAQTVNLVGVGEVFAIAGQSNASGYSINPQPWSHPTLKACTFANDYQWKELSDPTDSAVGQIDTISSDTLGGSYWPHMVTDLMAALNVPVALIPCAKGSSDSSQWIPAADHFNRSTLYGSMANRIRTVGPVRAVLWHQGEGDALAGTAQATYQSRLITIANALKADVDTVLMPCLIQNSSGATDESENVIRAAISAAAAGNDNIYIGPDLSDMTTDDTFHLRTDAKMLTAGQRWAAAIMDSGLLIVPSVIWVLSTGDPIALVGTNQVVNWSSQGASDAVRIALSLDGGITWPIDLASAADNSGSFEWIPQNNHVTPAAMIQVSDAAEPEVAGLSGSFIVATTDPGVGGQWLALARKFAAEAGYKVTP